jgi:hypothetical protein
MVGLRHRIYRYYPDKYGLFTGLVLAGDSNPDKPIAAKAIFCNIVIISAAGWGV